MAKKPALRQIPKIVPEHRFSECSHAFDGDGMRRIAQFFREGRFFFGKYSPASPTPSSILTRVRVRWPSTEKWKKAWRWFLWVPAVIFVNDHVISVSPVNGISMRPTVSFVSRIALIVSLILIRTMADGIGLWYGSFC